MNAHVLSWLLLGIQLILTTAWAAAPTPGDVTAGKAIYERLCISCHGLDGRGGRMATMLPVRPQNLTDQAYMNTRSDRQLIEVIRRGGAAVGLSSSMGAFGDQLTELEIRDTVAYVRALAMQTPVAAGTPETKGLQPFTSSPLHMAHLRLSIWPEYDDPRVLIMFRGEMSPPSAFPTRIGLPIPKGAEIIGAGMVSEQNELIIHPHQVIPGDGNDELKLNLPTPRFFAEFYYTPATTKTDKHFTYTLPIPYAIKQLEIDIQQPRHATNFITDPTPMRQRTDDQGFIYHLFAYRNIEKGIKKDFTISYTKTVAAPSVAKQRTVPKISKEPPSTTHKMLMALALLMGAAILFGGSAWLYTGYQQRHRPPPPSLPAMVQPNPEILFTSGSRSRPSSLANYCSNCGVKLQLGYHFCPGCGTAVGNSK